MHRRAKIVVLPIVVAAGLAVFTGCVPAGHDACVVGTWAMDDATTVTWTFSSDGSLDLKTGSQDLLTAKWSTGGKTLDITDGKNVSGNDQLSYLENKRYATTYTCAADKLSFKDPDGSTGSFTKK